MKVGNKVVLAAFVAMTFLSGCASVPMASKEMDASAKQFTAPVDKSKIYVFRNETLGAALKMPVTLDGKAIGDTGSKTYFMLEVTPGTHVLTSQGNESTLTVEAEAGKTYYVWQEVKMGMMSGGSKLQLVSEDKGQAGVKESKLAVTKQSFTRRPRAIGCSCSWSCQDWIEMKNLMSKVVYITCLFLAATLMWSGYREAILMQLLLGLGLVVAVSVGFLKVKVSSDN